MRFPSPEKRLYFKNLVASKFLNIGKDASKLQPETILVVKLDEFGDMANATHVFELLKKKYPNAIITLLCKPFLKQLLENAPSIDSIITKETEWDKAYDVVVELRGTEGTLKKSYQYKPSFRVDRGTVRFRNRGNQKQEVYTNYEIIKPLVGELECISPRIYIGLANESFRKDFMERYQLKKYVVIHAGARMELRKWKAENYAKICDYLVQELGLGVVLAGGKDDEATNQKIKELAGANVHIMPEGNTLLDFASIAENAALFIGNESGPMHIASCMKTPILGLFGPGVKEVFYPFYEKSNVIHYILECNPCDQIHCVTPGNTCMDRIGVQEVRLAIKELLV